MLKRYWSSNGIRVKDHSSSQSVMTWWKYGISIGTRLTDPAAQCADARSKPFYYRVLKNNRSATGLAIPWLNCAIKNTATQK